MYLRNYFPKKYAALYDLNFDYCYSSPFSTIQELPFSKRLFLLSPQNTTI